MRSSSASGMSDRSSMRCSSDTSAIFSTGGKCSRTIREAARIDGRSAASSQRVRGVNEPPADLHKFELNGVLALADGPLDIGGAAAHPVVP